MPNTITNRTDTILSHAVGISIMIAFLLPHNTPYLLLANPLIVIAFKLFNKNRFFYKNCLVVIIPILITLLINITQDISFKSIQRGLTILLYFLCFPFVGSVKVPRLYIYATFIYIFISQFYTLLDIPALTNYINTYYPMSEYSEGAITYIDEHVTAENFNTYRHAGIFRNSNACAEALCMLLAFYLIYDSKEPTSLKVTIGLVMYYAIFITGSRTGFIVSSFIIMSFLLFNDKYSTSLRLPIVAGVFIAAIVFFHQNMGDFRALDIQAGLESSANSKMTTFLSYLSNENSPLKLLLGYWDSSIYRDIAEFNVMKSFDSDYGSIIFSYGFIGLISILLFFYGVYKEMSGTARLFFVLILWMATATIIKSYRMIFIFMLLLSIIYSNNNFQKKETQFSKNKANA